MKIDIEEKTVCTIVMESNAKGSGYNGAWLDGYRHLAVLLGIVTYDYDKDRYVANDKKEKGND